MQGVCSDDAILPNARLELLNLYDRNNCRNNGKGTISSRRNNRSTGKLSTNGRPVETLPLTR
jgi:hypothetical protein